MFVTFHVDFGKSSASMSLMASRELNPSSNSLSNASSFILC